MKPSGSLAPSVIVVAIILGLETLLAAGVSGFLVYEVLVDTADSLASAWGLVIMSLMATAWITATTWGFIRGKSFARGSALVWQVLQGALGLASNQGLFARPDIGSGLLVPAIIVLALLLFSKPVGRHLGAPED
jgi:hypothetical protein